MSENIIRLRSLLRKYAANQATEGEITEMLHLLKGAEGDSELESIVWELRNEQPVEMPVDWERMWMNIRGLSGNSAPVILWRTGRRLLVAASILLVLGVSVWLLLTRGHQQALPVNSTVVKVQDVAAPDRTRAVITLADGSKVYLDSAGNGTLAKQGSVQVVKQADGKIVYYNTDQDPSGDLLYNSIYNPRGSKVIALALSDGTQVWLNAESSLRYPAVFTGNERKVEITGEAYFEVAHDAKKPFSVSKDAMQVQVLGTHFNVNAYEDEEAIRITLLEGSVKVSVVSARPDDPVGRGQLSVLKPGQQAVLTHNSQLTTHNDVDIEGVMAWKNGIFYLNNVSVGEIMRQAQRWYGVDVTYEGDVKDERFGGSIPRQENFSELVKMLELTKTIRIIIANRKVTVKPYR